MKRYTEVDSNKLDIEEIKPNTLWKNPNSNREKEDIYILAKFGGTVEKRKVYIAISLLNADRWVDPTENIKEAVRGLEPFSGEITLGQKF